MSLETVIAAANAARPHIQGWCNEEKATALIEAICSRKPELCVEIGVFGGSSLIQQALAIKDNGVGRIEGIDPWSVEAALEEMNDAKNREWWGSDVDLESVYRRCQEAVKKFGVQDVVGLIRDKAENVACKYLDESIDLLHIDGNHSELLSFKDATLYLPKVKPGGLIFFDDVWWTDGHNQPTTRKAIVFLQEHCTKLRLVDQCMILQKD